RGYRAPFQRSAAGGIHPDGQGD
ncbi:putative phage tail fiber protein, partial [Escherichia coli 90.0091]